MKTNIYIVDDIQENLQVLGNILKKEGYNISIARSGEQAITGIKKKIPDLVLLDISMPGMNGYEVCENLKKDIKTCHIPIIYLTARTQTEDIVLGFKTGGVDYITKPFNSEELLSRVKTHLELKKTRERLVELNATKDKFFRIIAHDLKSPFNSLLGIISLILEDIDEFSKNQIKEFLLQLYDKSQTTYELIENLLEWARSQSGEIIFNPENIQISELINGNLILLKENASNKNIKLVAEIQYNGTVYADKNMINTVLRNLILNSIKFTSIEGKVIVKVEETSDGIQVSITDTGVGISKEDILKLFRIDVHHSTIGTENEKGTGLGLIICKEFVLKHGGTIWVESEVNKGSTFKFILQKNR